MDSSVDVLIIFVCLVCCAFGMRRYFHVLQGNAHGYNLLMWSKLFPKQYQGKLLSLVEQVVASLSRGERGIGQQAAFRLDEYMNECIMFHPNNLAEIKQMKTISGNINSTIERLIQKQ